MQTIKKFMATHFLQYAMMLFSVVVLSLSGYSQNGPPPPSGGTGPGSIPDSPLGGVPFDWRMNLALLFAGVVFAFIIMKKIGTKIKTWMVEVIIPPTIGAAIGFITSEPIPDSHRMGAKLASTAITVISFGRSLVEIE